MSSLRNSLLIIQRDLTLANQENADLDTVFTHLGETREGAERLTLNAPLRSGQRFYGELSSALRDLMTAKDRVQAAPIRRADFFSTSAQVELNPQDEAIRDAIQRLRELPIHG